MILFIRGCIDCGVEIHYKNKRTMKSAEKRNAKCRSCSKMGKNNGFYGKSHSVETILKIKENRPNMSGKNNPMYGKTGKDNPNYGRTHTEASKLKMKQNSAKYWLGKPFSKETKQKMHDAQIGKTRRPFSEETKLKMRKAQLGKTRSLETRRKISKNMSDRTGKNNPMYGKPGPKLGVKMSNETKLKLRLAKIKRLENLHGQLFPAYNPNSIPVIEEYGKKHDYNFQHAENGGEYHVKELGYWVDGYDKEKNIVIEIDEPYHKYQIDKDIQRQHEITKFLGCEFIRIKIK